MNVTTKPPKIDVTTGSLPASKKIYVSGERYPDLRIPMREIELHESANEPPFPVYDTSGPYTDPDAHIDLDAGLPGYRHVDAVSGGPDRDVPGVSLRAAFSGACNRSGRSG